jgi:diguanylate cyclase (GGDEF)-like protein
MEEVRQETLPRRGFPRSAGVLTLIATLLSLGAGSLAWQELERGRAAERKELLEHRLERLSAAIEARAAAHRQVLRSARALVLASGEVNRQEWHTFVEALRLMEDYPGIQGVGLSVLVSPTDLANYEATQRSGGVTDFRVHPAGDREVFSAIQYLEPLDWRNQRALGFDMYQEPVRREAMLRARESGEAALSGRVTLVQETETDPQPGVLLYLPVQRHIDGKLVLDGWVYSPYRMGDLLGAALSVERSGLWVRVFDGERLDKATLLYDSAPSGVSAGELDAGLKSQQIVMIDGREWLIRAEAYRGFGEVGGQRTLTLLSILMISGLFIATVALFAVTRARAVELEALTGRLKRSEHRLEDLATHDPLTGVANLRALEARMRLELAHVRRGGRVLGVLYLDLDYFKQINDRMGHRAGDQLLIEASRRMQACLRESDLLARRGGDEFVVLLGAIDGFKQAEVVASRLGATLAEPFPLEAGVGKVSASIGLSLSPEHGLDPDELLSRADAALYEAKATGRNRLVVWVPGLTGHAEPTQG